MFSSHSTIIYGSGSELRRLLLLESLCVFPRLCGSIRVFIFLSLKNFKKYWLPLLFWVGISAFGLLPGSFIKTGSQRSVKGTSLIYFCSFEVFILVLARLISFVFPHNVKQTVKTFLQENDDMFFFDFNLGDLSYHFFLKFLRFFMKRYRFSIYNNCIARIFINSKFLGGSVYWSRLFLPIFLTKGRVPVEFMVNV